MFSVRPPAAKLRQPGAAVRVYPAAGHQGAFLVCDSAGRLPGLSSAGGTAAVGSK